MAVAVTQHRPRQPQARPHSHNPQPLLRRSPDGEARPGAVRRAGFGHCLRSGGNHRARRWQPQAPRSHRSQACRRVSCRHGEGVQVERLQSPLAGEVLDISLAVPGGSCGSAGAWRIRMDMVSSS